MGEATFMLSLDCEGKWGLADCLDDVHAGLTTGELIDAYRDVIAVLDTCRIEATFAFVGAFVAGRAGFERAFTELELSVPHLRYLRALFDDLERGREEGWFAPAALELVRGAEQRHEIASHGFTHVPLRSYGLDADKFRRELALGRSLIPGGDAIESFVYPRNEVGLVECLSQAGFHGYRAAPGHGPLQVAMQELGVARRDVAHAGAGRRPVAVPAGSFLNWRRGIRARIPVRATVGTWRRAIRRAASSGSVVHLYLHPHNLVTGDRMPELFAETMNEVARARDRGELRTMTMGEYVRSRRRGNGHADVGL